MNKAKVKKAEIVVQDNCLVVDYIDKDNTDASFVVESLDDIKCLKKELIEAGYVKCDKYKEHWQK